MTLTVSRIVGALLLLLIVYALGISPLSFVFFTVYAFCIASDLLDGYLARRHKVTSKLGATLDSSADMLVAISMLFIFIPYLDWASWMILMVVIVLSTRALTMIVGFIKYRTLTMLHTYSTKGAALTLASFPFLYLAAGLTVTVLILFVVVILAFLEELFIIVRSKEFNPDITSMLSL